jgi:hypothetical protein
MAQEQSHGGCCTRRLRSVMAQEKSHDTRFGDKGPTDSALLGTSSALGMTAMVFSLI